MFWFLNSFTKNWLKIIKSALALKALLYTYI
jgi:hypothetical protein